MEKRDAYEGHEDIPGRQHEEDRAPGRHIRDEQRRSLRAQRHGLSGAPGGDGKTEDGRPLWFPDWREADHVVVIASGPSAKDEDLDGLVKGRARSIVVNESWRLAPWADVLYGCDGMWWRRSEGVPKFAGLKITQDGNVCSQFRDVMRISVNRKTDRILTETPGLVGWAGNGGFQALNLAVQFGPPRVIVLVGFDMRLDRGLHWHGRHGRGLNNPREQNVIRWRRALNDAAQQLADLGILVINASEHSALTAYRKMPLEEALQC